jgi:hypothetical protein
VLPKHHNQTASNYKNSRNPHYNKQATLLVQGEFMQAFYEDIADAGQEIQY